jgi:crotonobetainyl-CoA:carnitine CoA-transferase CaiB-like acyl-CoA transferase
MDLSGLTVLDFTHLLPGPYATQLLADAGADVVKVEPPGGDPARHLPLDADRPGTLFPLLNRGKESVVVDLTADGADRALAPLFAEADAVVEQYRPGVADRLGIGEAAVREHAPEVVYCSLTGYGQTGPNRERVGHDLNYVGEAGLLDMTRSGRDAAPAIPGVTVADTAGGLVAAFSLVAALLSRELGTASGEYVDVSMTDATRSLGQALAASALFGGSPRPGETALTGRQPCYGVYETADGRYLTVAAIEPEFWTELCRALDHEELIDAHMASDPATREAVRETLAATFATRTREEWLDALADRNVMVGAVRTPEEAFEAPAAREREQVLDPPDAPPRLGFPAVGEVSARESPPPDLGADTRAVLCRAGLDDETVSALSEQGVIGGG